jgi:hypothetical protein
VVADFDQNGTMDVFVVAGYGTYTPDSMNVGVAVSIEGGTNASGCPEWRMFRQDVQRTGYLSADDITENCAILAVEENPGQPFTLYPNPATRRIHLQGDFPAGAPVFLSLTDMQGRVVLAQPQVGSEVELNLPSGVYSWYVEAGGQVSRGRLIILH